MYIWEKLFSYHGAEYVISGAAFFMFILLFLWFKPKKKF
jgi:hypothetical protein